MVAKEQVSAFIRTTFRSVWSLELLLFLAEHNGRSWQRDELVAALRASDLIVAQSVDLLLAAGLISVDEAGSASYAPASRDLAALVDGAASLYARSPDAVRRQIIASATSDLTAFADAFRLRKD